MWISKALQRAFTNHNITSGFCTTGIHPLNPEAMEPHLGPSTQFGSGTYLEQPGHPLPFDSDQDDTKQMEPKGDNISCDDAEDPNTLAGDQVLTEIQGELISKS